MSPLGHAFPALAVFLAVSAQAEPSGQADIWDLYPRLMCQNEATVSCHGNDELGASSEITCTPATKVESMVIDFRSGLIQSPGYPDAHIAAKLSAYLGPFEDHGGFHFTSGSATMRFGKVRHVFEGTSASITAYRIGVGPQGGNLTRFTCQPIN